MRRDAATPTDIKPSHRQTVQPVVGLARILLFLSLLFALFAVYRLWGTGIEYRQAQSALTGDFRSAQLEVRLPENAPPATTAPSTSAPDDGLMPGTPPDDNPPPTDPLPPEVDDSVVTVNVGDPLAMIEMPTIEHRSVVVAGATLGAIKRGPGHDPRTPMPGELGNMVIYGHRTSYGAPFGSLDALRVGDPVVVTDIFSVEHTYRVTRTEIVTPRQTSSVATIDGSRATLSLVTCHPKWSTARRLVVHAELVGLSEPPDDTPGSEPTVTVVYEQPEEGIPDGADPLSVDSPELDISDPATGEMGSDAFRSGWFADRSAWPHVGLWGAALLAVVAISSSLSWRTGRRWVGRTVAVVPFLVVCYFWFQNVSRLLPPGM
jgi:sortase A